MRKKFSLHLAILITGVMFLGGCGSYRSVMKKNPAIYGMPNSTKGACIERCKVAAKRAATEAARYPIFGSRSDTYTVAYDDQFSACYYDEGCDLKRD